MIKRLVYFFMVLFSSTLFAQEQKVVTSKLNSLEIEADAFVGYDNLGYYYYVKNNVFFKQKEAELWQYQNVALGEITKIDIINPLKIVVFYENFNQVILLDNQLNEIMNLNFSDEQEPIIAHAVGLSAQNNLWVFNSISQKIGLFNFESKKYVPLNQPLKNNFVFYQSDFNHFYWVDENLQFYSIDYFGKITALNKILPFEGLQFGEELGIFILKNGCLYYSKKNTSETFLVPIDEKTIKSFAVKNKILSIFTGKQIVNYNLNLP